MEKTSFLVSDYDLEKITFTKPKKHNDFLISKVKYPETDLLLQFPKMTVQPSEITFKNIELAFKNQIGYNKKIQTFLKELDSHVIKVITENSKEWFGKKIPTDSVSKMYNPFVKTPQTPEDPETIGVSFLVKRTELLTELVNAKNEPIDFADIHPGNTLECIIRLKYLIFSKESSFVTWEISCAKMHKRVQRVPKFGFIENPDDRHEKCESEDEDLEIHTFF